MSDKLLLSHLTTITLNAGFPFQILSPTFPFYSVPGEGTFLTCVTSVSLSSTQWRQHQNPAWRKGKLVYLFSSLSLLAMDPLPKATWLLAGSLLPYLQASCSYSSLQCPGMVSFPIPPRGEGRGEMETSLLLTQGYLTNPCWCLLTLFTPL